MIEIGQQHKATTTTVVFLEKHIVKLTFVVTDFSDRVLGTFSVVLPVVPS